MDKEAEGRIEKRLRNIFSNGMPDWAFDKNGLQTRGTFLKNRPRSPFSHCLKKRARVETMKDEVDEAEEEREKDEGEVTEGEVGDGVEDDEDNNNNNNEVEDGEDGGKESESSGSEDSDDEEVVDGAYGEEERRIFRQRVRDNRRYQARMLVRK